MKLPKFISNNLVLKITSVNAFVTGIRLAISFFVQRQLAEILGNSGYKLVGDIRNLIPMLTSTSSLGMFNGAIKYVAELRDNRPELSKVFSSITVFYVFGSLITSLILYLFSADISLYVFDSLEFISVIRFLAIMAPFIGLNRICSSIINGKSDYKNYAKVELIAYLLSTVLLLIGLFYYNIKGVMFAIALTPLIQLLISFSVYGKTIISVIQPKKLTFSLSYRQQLISFTLMSFVSTFLINFIDINLRGVIANHVSEGDAGNWTAMTFISKNYMVFASGLFTLYVLPKFAKINTDYEFKKEVLYIYKTILPIFGIGMILVYLLRFVIINLIYEGFDGMAPLFKWQLFGDFTRLCFLVLTHQFLAKKMVKNYIFIEFFSLIIFYVLSMLLVESFKTEGIVMAHFFRSIAVLGLVIFIFRKALFFSKKEDDFSDI